MNYILDEIPRGQLNNVILSTMLDGDKYGYEIIEEISSLTAMNTLSLLNIYTTSFYTFI